MKKLLILHGPNLNLLGLREPNVYGNLSLENINEEIKKFAQANNIKVEFKQSNYEGELVEAIQQAPKQFSAIVINPAAFTHTSIALRDAIAAINIPVIEVHLSNIYNREEFRQRSLISPVAAGQISGFGANSYILGIKAAIDLG